MTAVGLGMSLRFRFWVVFPATLTLSVSTLATFAFLIQRVTRNDDSSIELEGGTWRARYPDTVRVRGIRIRYQDHQTPLMVSRVDSAMTNAAERRSAIVYRMAERKPVDVEMKERNGLPSVHRVDRHRD